jgi:hypothetical protein
MFIGELTIFIILYIGYVLIYRGGYFYVYLNGGAFSVGNLLCMEWWIERK